MTLCCPHLRTALFNSRKTVWYATVCGDLGMCRPGKVRNHFHFNSEVANRNCVSALSRMYHASLAYQHFNTAMTMTCSDDLCGGQFSLCPRHVYKYISRLPQDLPHKNYNYALPLSFRIFGLGPAIPLWPGHGQYSCH
jgi:hypothetical protein